MTQAPHRRLFITAVLVTAASLASLPAQASEGETKKAGDPSVQLGSVAIPVTVDGRLANYLFLSIRINLNMAANEARLRQQEPYFRDALVRTASKISFGQPGKDYLLDEPRFKQVMIGEWAKIAGPNAIKSIDILTQSPKRHPY